MDKSTRLPARSRRLVVRRSLASLVVGVCAVPLTAQQHPDPAVTMAAKLASPFLRVAEWTTDLAVARERATARGQLILGYFTTAGP